MIPDPEFVDDPVDPYDVAELIPAPGVFDPGLTARSSTRPSSTGSGTIHIADSIVRDNFANH